MIALVTGGTGSFGRRFVSRVLALGWRVRVLSRDEQKQEAMAQELPAGAAVSFLLGDVRDRQRVRRAAEGVDLIVHAAALKMVHLGEYNPDEVIRTNIGGTQNVRDAALDCGVSRMIVLSSDKAVEPINLYGMTKACAERVAIHGNSYAGGRPIRCSCVRYGNVLASRGSVIETYARREAEDRPLPVTDPRMTRFWMSQDEAVDLVLLAAREMRGGEIFVPKIGSAPLATIASMFRGPHEETGIRPGEKIHEALIAEHEAPRTTDCGSHYVIWPDRPQWGEVQWRGAPVPIGFSLMSNKNTTALDEGALKELIDAHRIQYHTPALPLHG